VVAQWEKPSHRQNRAGNHHHYAMTATIFDSGHVVKSDRPFGDLPASERREPYTQADLDWAAQFFGALEDARQLEEQALQARWDDQFNRTFPVGCCQMCGELSAG